jgi:hypothetical protein
MVRFEWPRSAKPSSPLDRRVKIIRLRGDCSSSEDPGIDEVVLDGI